MTPWQLREVGKAQGELMLDALERLIALAWHTANFSRAKRLPELRPLLKKVRTGGDVDRVAEARAAMDSILSAPGVKVIDQRKMKKSPVKKRERRSRGKKEG